MRVLFLSANEDLNNGLMKSQFIKPIEELLNKNGKEIEVIIINIHKPFGKKYKNKFIKVVNLPFLIPFRFINFTFLFFLNEIITFFYSLLLLIYIKRNDILYTRAYVPGLVGFWLNKIKKINYVFDPRSLYVHECLDIFFSKESVHFKYWMNVEKKVVLNASKIISVSKGQLDYYSKNYGVEFTKSLLIPCFADEKKMLSDSKKQELRNKIGLSEDDLVIGYIGSLNNGWNNINLYKEYFKKCIENGYKVLIISQDKKRLHNDKFFLNENFYIFSFDDVIEDFQINNSFIQISDFGLVLLKSTHDWFTRLTVKFVDYTSNGVPVIAHKNVGEACNLINEYKLLPSAIISNIDELTDLRKPTLTEKLEIRNWSNNYFSISNINKILN